VLVVSTRGCQIEGPVYIKYNSGTRTFAEVRSNGGVAWKPGDAFLNRCLSWSACQQTLSLGPLRVARQRPFVFVLQLAVARRVACARLSFSLLFFIFSGPLFFIAHLPRVLFCHFGQLRR
jgi:hypothetical protein